MIGALLEIHHHKYTMFELKLVMGSVVLGSHFTCLFMACGSRYFSFSLSNRVSVVFFTHVSFRLNLKRVSVFTGEDAIRHTNS